MYEKHLDECFAKADRRESKITEDVLRIEGMSGDKTRHFYNNVCSLDYIRYLEIGTWRGSSICSAMCNNQISCVCVDDWSEFGGSKNAFSVNFNRFKEGNDALFIESCCWKLDPTKLAEDGKFNVYMYDGDHSEECHFRALNHFIESLQYYFIYMVDDWNWPDVRKGTFDSINRNNLEVLYFRDINTETREERSEWHNGIGVFVLRKFSRVKNFWCGITGDHDNLFFKAGLEGINEQRLHYS
jgi:hypothetical protein